MKRQSLIHLLVILITPLGIGILLGIFSLTIGWNLFTMIVFWFVMIPVLAYVLPRLISKEIVRPRESIIGLLILYGVMILMIFNHADSDFFIIMVISLLVNIGVVTLIFQGRAHRHISSTLSSEQP